MNLGLSADAVAAGVAVCGLLGGGWGAYLHLKDSTQQKEIDRMAGSLKSAFDAIDKLKEDRAALLKRDEHDDFRREIKDAIDKMGVTLGAAIDKLGTRLDKIVDERRV